MSAEEALVDENFRHALAICSVVFHEMRHLYQKEAVRVYSVSGRPFGMTSIFE